MRELRERAEPILKIVCFLLAALVIFQLAGIVVRWNPFRGVVVPALPTLTANTNSPAVGARATNLAVAAGKGTNGAPLSPGTNLVAAGANSNSMLQNMPANTGSNSALQVMALKTNANAESNGFTPLGEKLSGTNASAATNMAVNAINNLSATNGAGTTVALSAKPEKKMAGGAPMPQMAGMNFNPFGSPARRGADLPPAVQARIGRIVDSEILGPVMHPLPMALMGIAGEFAFLRSASGQTGLVKTGDSLDDIKLLRIGINRVLIEQGGQKKELMIFSGYGGDSLLPTNTPDENNHP
jgi:hypothetical protein